MGFTMSTLAINLSGIRSARMRLQAYVDRAVARLRMQEFLNAMLVVSMLSAWMLLAFLLADKFFSLAKIGINVWIIWGGLTCLGIPYTIWRVFSPRIHNNLAAVLADDRLGLHARLCTALTLDLDDPNNAAFGEAFFSEALGKLERLDVERAFPIRVPRAYLLLILPLAACAGASQMEYQDKLGLVEVHENKRKADAQKQKTAASLEGKLQDLKQKVDEQSGEKTGQYKVNQLIKDAEEAAKNLKDGKHTTEETLMQLGQIKREVEEQKEKITQGKEFTDRLEKLKAQDLNLEDSAMTKAVSEALKMGDANLAARELRKMAQEVRKNILDDPKKTPEQKKAELEKLKREVEKLAGALAQDENLREGLRELSEKTMDAAEFQSLQDEIKKTMEKQGKDNKSMGQDIEQQIERVAEELERLDEDNDANLTEDEEKEMDNLDAVEKGVDEAMDGLVNEDGSEKGQQGGKEQGGKQQGGKQGGQQGKQGKDGKSGKSGKKKGSQSGQKGGQQGGKEGQQGGKEGQQSGQGGKDGEKGGQQAGDGQNGGGKGSGFRARRDVADAGFTAEKVKGQMQSGAITGLSHFRGQGAKGDAPVEFKTALQNAERENATSLELERIPVDAREVVKDYFTKVRQGAAIEAPAPPTPPAPKTPVPPAGPKKESVQE